jgi:hypothetical protein
MDRPKLIGITGRKFNGKDTLGNYYVEKYGYIKLAFADSLKKGCAEIFGFSDEQLYGNLKETTDDFWKITPRTVLQYIGTDLFREQLNVIIPEIGQNIWTKVVEKKIFDIRKTNPNACFVITDVRFQNECDLVRKLGGVVVRIKRNSVNNTIDTHQSEIEMENLQVDFEIENNGEKSELFSMIEDLIIWSVV